MMKMPKNNLLFAASAMLFLTASFCSAAQGASPDSGKPKTSVKQKFGDLTAHPLAGEKVEVELEVRDAQEQTGKSKKMTGVLPKKGFVHPANPYLAGLRRSLAEAYMNSPDAARRAASKIASDLGRFIKDHARDLKSDAALGILKSTQKKLSSSQDAQTADQALHDVWDAMMLLEEGIIKEAQLRQQEEYEELMKAMENLIREQQDLMDKTMMRSNAGRPDFKKMMEDIKNLANAIDRKVAEQIERHSRRSDEMMKKLDEAAKDLSERLEGQEITEEQRRDATGREDRKRADLIEKYGKIMDRLNKMKAAAESMKGNIGKAQQDDQEVTEDQIEKILDEIDKMQADLQDALNQNQEDDMSEMVQESLEELTRDLSGQVDEQIDRERQRREELDKEAASGGGAQGGQKKETAQNRKNQDRLEEMKSDLEGIDRKLQDNRKNNAQLPKEEAEGMTDKLEDMQKELQDMKGSQQEMSKNQQPANKPGGSHDNGKHKNESGGNGTGEETEMEKEGGKRSVERLRQQMRKNSQDLGGKQGRLEKKLQDVIGKLKSKGIVSGEMNGAGDQMREASQKLGEGRPGSAVPNQNRALESLSVAARQMARQPSREQGEGRGTGRGRGGDPSSDSTILMESGGDADQAGSPGMNSANRTRNELRKRLGKPDLSPQERQYYEGLLESGKSKPRESPRP